MVITAFYRTRADGKNLYKTASDSDYKIQNESGVLYNYAIDVENSGHTYTETTEIIDDGDADVSDYEGALAELGVADEEENSGS